MVTDAPNNAVLATFPPEARHEIHSKLKEKRLARGTTVFRPGAASSEVYFPLGGIVSVVALMDNSMVEMATIGREGMVELSGQRNHPLAFLRSSTRKRSRPQL